MCRPRGGLPPLDVVASFIRAKLVDQVLDDIADREETFHAAVLVDHDR